MDQSPFEFKLDHETQDVIEQEIMRRISCAVADSEGRDDQYEQFADQVEGLIGASGDNQPWEGASEVNDPLTMEQFLTMWAMMNGAMDRNPPVMVEPTKADDEEKAAIQEAYIPLKLNEGGFRQAKSGLIFNGLRYPVAIAYVGYEQKVRDEWEDFDKDPETGKEVKPEEKDDEVQYEKGYKSVPVVVSDGLEVRCVDTPNFYLYPATQTDLQRANGCGERLWWSQDDLLANIDDLGLDEEAVYTLIAHGPTHDPPDGNGDRRSTKNERDGVEGPESADGLYEIFQWYCKPPLLFDGDENGLDFLVPKRYLKKDLCVICCAEAMVMLRIGLSTHGHTRPYVPFYTWPIPDSFYGWCVPQILDSIQSEANANVQHTINCMNMQIQPAMKVQENMLRRYENLKLVPGAMIPFQSSPNEVEPFQFPVTSSVGYETQQWLGSKAEKLITAGGFGSIQPKQRKAAEVQATTASAATKADLVIYNFNGGLEQLWIQAAAILADNMPEDGEDFLDEEETARKITPKMLKGRFTYRPVANGQNADPAARVALAQAKGAAADEYLALKGNPQTPIDVVRLKWHNTRAVLRDMGEHSPDLWIGPEPQEQQAPPPMPGGVPGAPGMPGAAPPAMMPPPMGGEQ